MIPPVLLLPSSLTGRSLQPARNNATADVILIARLRVSFGSPTRALPDFSVFLLGKEVLALLVRKGLNGLEERSKPTFIIV
ncbi:MAG: hypothetical protein KTR14_07630, partial [Vampirovibrio sp.]|nr:hypothetical protein [Vampirovibrio sp.]